jgi:DNA (cytosine-5)-methyltransferase 1
MAGDDSPVWTGSCPCQPFSAAGKRKGFDDERHLWPSSAPYRRATPCSRLWRAGCERADWLRLVRGDLEALEYAVGAMPIEAASAGADHLRDRFWFVGD